MGTVGCVHASGGAPPPVPCATTASAPIASTAPRESAPPLPSKLASLRLVLRPEPGDSPHLHVDLFVQSAPQGSAPGAPAKNLASNTLRLVTGAVEDIGHLVVEDGQGTLAVVAANAPPGVTATLERVPQGTLHIAYDVRATANPNANTSDLVIADDRFRGLGERIVLLPSGMENERANVSVIVDTRAIVAPRFASSLGLGQRTREGYGRSLVRAAFMAGSLGGGVFDEGIDHDETVWLGYSAFDPRPAAAEVATVRTALREMWHGGGDEDFTLLFVSSPRPLGAYALVPRAGSLLVHLGPSEPWLAPLRVAVTQHLMRSWIGGELRILPPSEGGNEAESLWFAEGVARYFAAHALRRLGLITVDDARDFANGLLSAQATSPHRGKSNAAVATLAFGDPLARAHLMAHGALYATRLAGLLRLKKGAQSLDDVVAKLVERARTARAPLPSSAWVEAVVGALGPAEKAQFERLIVAGEDVTLSPDALGSCLRGGAGVYTAFDLGFDLDETLEAVPRTIVRLRAGGPAARAGLSATDVLDDATFRYGHAEAPVTLSVLRDGHKADVKYLPRGVSAKGLVYTRKTGVPDLVCGDVL